MRDFETSMPTKTSLSSSRARPPCVKALPGLPGNPSNAHRGHTVFAAPLLAMTLLSESLTIEANFLAHGRKRRRDLLERFALGVDGVARCNERGGEHEARGENVAPEKAVARSTFDQLAKNERRGDATDAGSDGVKDRDGHRANFDRESLADRKIGRARRWRSDEEHDHPSDRLAHRRQEILLEGDGDGDHEHAGEPIGQRDHDAAPKRVEQAPENDGTQEVAEREGQNIPANGVAADRVEFRQDERVGEKNGVVEERLRRHQRQPDEGLYAMPVDQRVEHFAERRVVARAQADGFVGGDRLELRPLVLKSLFDSLDDVLAFFFASVDREPTRTLGHPHAHEKDGQTENSAGQERKSPSPL